MNTDTKQAVMAILLICSLTSACRPEPQKVFSAEELSLIWSADSIMRVLTIRDSPDTAVLRAESTDIPASTLMSGDFAQLSRLMLATVTHPSQDGVGIAAPQVGLNRRVVAVQRFDKEGFPFEVYPNIRIVWASDSLACGPEGCLSVPDMRGNVMRSTEIVIEYTDTRALAGAKSLRRSRKTPLPVKRDTVRGFTAVIFQHETDHLDGILYTDRLLDRD